MLANREGLFHGYPVEIGLGQTKGNQLLQVVILYRLTEELVGNDWIDCSAEGLQISGYHILEKKDHSLNDNTIEALKAALGWDGRDPFWLQDNAQQVAGRPVQVKLAFEEYNGSQTLKVAFLNPYGSRMGGVPRADDELRRGVTNRLGAKFRALAGGTPANPPAPAGKPTTPAPAKPAPASSAPSAPAAPPPAAPPATPATATMEEAWQAFVTEYTSKPGGNEQDMQQQWFAILATLFPGKQPDQLGGSDWAVMLAQGPARILPF